MAKSSFLKGAAILAFAGLAARIIGAAFRIPLTYVIGAEGMGLYQMAYPIYAFLLVASTSGLPVAISKLVSERTAMEDTIGANKIFLVALKMLIWLGALSTILLFLVSSGLANLIGNPDAVYSILSIAPALFFVSVLAAFRGYFQGLQIMSPTAFSQLVEQAGRLVIGLILAAVFMGYGVEYGAAGAIAGVTMSSVLALFVLILMYRRYRIKTNSIGHQAITSDETNRSVVAKILRIAIPVTIGASVMPFVNLMDKLMVVNILSGNNILPWSGSFSVSEATSLYGILTGFVNPLVNLPSLFTVALAMSLVPAISESYATKDKAGIARRATTGIRVTVLIAFPAFIGIAILAEPIVSFLYRTLSSEETYLAARILGVSAVGIAFLALIQSLTAILQGINRPLVPVRNLMIGAAFKIVATFVLVSIPEINVLGAAYGTVICYIVAAILNLIQVKKFIRLRNRLRDIMVKPALSAMFMGICVHLLYNYVFEPVLGLSFGLIMTIAFGATIYAAALLFSGSIKRADVDFMPFGKRISKLLEKVNMLK